MHIKKDSKKRPGIRNKKIGFTIHSTANELSSARNERDWLENPKNQAYTSYNYVVDEKEAIECIPLNEISYHAGNKKGNWETVAIEMCESGDRSRVIGNTLELIRELHEAYRIPLKLYRHYDWLMTSGNYQYRKDCPRIFKDDNWKAWDDFKILVNKRLKGGSNMEDKVARLVREELEVEFGGEEVGGWAAEAVDYVKAEDIMAGYPDGSFKPNRYVTRAELAHIIYRLV